MSGWLALLAWALAASALHLRERRRLVLAARAGHEVRGPLCAARLALDGLEPSARVEAIEVELRRAALALEDLAGAGRGRGRGEAREPVDLGRLLRESAGAWQALAAAHGGTLEVEPAPVLALGDRLRLAQACANLVTNALEHGGGAVRVRASSAPGRARIEVSDTGPGLPAPLPALLAAARGRRSRRGHGLAIAAAIAKRHGGRLTSLPSPDGAHLVLELPEAPPGLLPPGRTAGPPALLRVARTAGSPRLLRVARTAGSPRLLRAARTVGSPGLLRVARTAGSPPLRLAPPSSAAGPGPPSS
jgi:signal transduction histidine kinase